MIYIYLYCLGVYSVSNRNAYQETFLRIKRDRRVRMTTLQSSVSRLSRRCGSLDISQLHEAPRPVRVIAFFTCTFKFQEL
jgi:hypothetical protein